MNSRKRKSISSIPVDRNIGKRGRKIAIKNSATKKHKRIERVALSSSMITSSSTILPNSEFDENELFRGKN